MLDAVIGRLRAAVKKGGSLVVEVVLVGCHGRLPASPPAVPDMYQSGFASPFTDITTFESPTLA